MQVDHSPRRYPGSIRRNAANFGGFKKTESPSDFNTCMAIIYKNNKFKRYKSCGSTSSPSYKSSSSDYENDMMDFSTFVEKDRTKDMRYVDRGNVEDFSDSEELYFLPRREFHPNGSNLNICGAKGDVVDCDADKGGILEAEYPPDITERVRRIKSILQIFETSDKRSFTSSRSHSAKRTKSQWTVVSDSIHQNDDPTTTTATNQSQNHLVEQNNQESRKHFETLRNGFEKASTKAKGHGDVNETRGSATPTDYETSLESQLNSTLSSPPDKPPSSTLSLADDDYVYKLASYMSTTNSICALDLLESSKEGVDEEDADFKVEFSPEKARSTEEMETLWVNDREFCSRASSKTSLALGSKANESAGEKQSGVDLFELMEALKSTRDEGRSSSCESSCEEPLIYDERFIGRADIFRPTLTKSERTMLGIASPPSTYLNPKGGPSSSSNAKTLRRRKARFAPCKRSSPSSSISEEFTPEIIPCGYDPKFLGNHNCHSETESTQDSQEFSLKDKEDAQDLEPEGWNWVHGDGYSFEVLGCKTDNPKVRKGMIYNLPWRDKMNQYDQKESDELDWERKNMSSEQIEDSLTLNARSRTTDKEESVDDILKRKSIKLGHQNSSSCERGQTLPPTQKPSENTSKSRSGPSGSSTQVDRSKSKSLPSKTDAAGSKKRSPNKQELSTYLQSVLPEPTTIPELKKRRDIIMKTLKWQIKVDKNAGKTSVVTMNSYKERILGVTEHYKKRKHQIKIKILEDTIAKLKMDHEFEKNKLKSKADNLKKIKLKETIINCCSEECEQCRQREVEKLDQKCRKDVITMEKKYMKKVEKIFEKISKTEKKFQTKMAKFKKSKA